MPSEIKKFPAIILGCLLILVGTGGCESPSAKDSPTSIPEPTPASTPEPATTSKPEPTPTAQSSSDEKLPDLTVDLFSETSPTVDAGQVIGELLEITVSVDNIGSGVAPGTLSSGADGNNIIDNVFKIGTAQDIAWNGSQSEGQMFNLSVLTEPKWLPIADKNDDGYFTNDISVTGSITTDPAQWVVSVVNHVPGLVSVFSKSAGNPPQTLKFNWYNKVDYIVKLYLSETATLPASEASYTFLWNGAVQNTNDLGPGDGITYSDQLLGARIPEGAQSGPKYLCAWVDPIDSVPEQNENNNFSCQPINIAPAAPGPGPVPTPTAQSSSEPKIAFSSDRDANAAGYYDGNYEIYVMNADGTDVKRLTNHPARDEEPSYSPDGNKIVFSSKRLDSNWEIYVMNADGTDVKRLTTNPGHDYAPSWSHDGKQIVFTSGRDMNFEIYVMNADGTDQKNLTNYPGAADHNASWSPNGDRIAFDSDRDGNTNVYVMNVDGTDQEPLTDHQSYDSDPYWSSNAEKIAFVSERDGNLEIYVMNDNGADQERLTNHPAKDTEPSWLPDGNKIAFDSRRDGNLEIYVMNLDDPADIGSNLTVHPSMDTTPSWSP